MPLTEKEILDFLYKKKKTLELELEKVNQAIMAFDSSIDFVSAKSEIKTVDLTVPSKYENRLKLDNKIIYILSLIKKGNKNEIVDKILSFEPNLEETKLLNNVAVRLSFLLKNRLIEASKVGKSYDYFLPS